MPAFWDVKRRPDKPNLQSIKNGLRFLADDAHPPFSFVGSTGAPTGFGVDIAREICAELELSCTVQAKPWNDLLPALQANEADVLVASLRPNGETRKSVLFTQPYYRPLARFVAKQSAALSVSDLSARRIGVVGESAHAAYLQAFFPQSTIVPFAHLDQALTAVSKGETDVVFGDGTTLAFWLNGTSSNACCEFVGEPYFESYFFGEGIGLALRIQDEPLKSTLDYALFRLWERGVYRDLTRRWFPLNPYGAGP